MNQNTTAVLDAVREMTYASLANDVPDIAGPDSETSAGANFLKRVRDALVENLEWRVEHEDEILPHAAVRLRDDTHEVADGAVPVYTFERWTTFVDLAAWQVDVSEYGMTGNDLTAMAGVALYEVARTLLDALCEYVETSWYELEDEGEQDDSEDQDLDSDPSN